MARREAEQTEEIQYFFSAISTPLRATFQRITPETSQALKDKQLAEFFLLPLAAFSDAFIPSHPNQGQGRKNTLFWLISPQYLYQPIIFLGIKCYNLLTNQLIMISMYQPSLSFSYTKISFKIGDLKNAKAAALLKKKINELSITKQ